MVDDLNVQNDELAAAGAAEVEVEAVALELALLEVELEEEFFLSSWQRHPKFCN